MRSTTPTDRVWLALCVASLVAYLWFSQAVSAFWREFVRLCAKF